MSRKSFRTDQSRDGNPERRRLEFRVVMDQVKRRRVAFMNRVSARLERNGDCLCYRGTLDHKGYARLNFRYDGQHVSIHAHRVFLILKLGRPIRKGYEAGHEPAPKCKHRTCVQHVREEHFKENARTAT